MTYISLSQYDSGQYAEDTILFIPFYLNAVDSTFVAFEQFHLKVNLNQTEIFPIDSLKCTSCLCIREEISNGSHQEEKF